MKIYRLTTSHSEHGNQLSYHSSKKRAMFELANAKKEYGNLLQFSDLKEYDVKSTRRDFIRFLNNHTPDKDNG